MRVDGDAQVGTVDFWHPCAETRDVYHSAVRRNDRMWFVGHKYGAAKKLGQEAAIFLANAPDV
jgi:hypothetical protein